jgi:hypothetical protein
MLEHFRSIYRNPWAAPCPDRVEGRPEHDHLPRAQQMACLERKRNVMSSWGCNGVLLG